MSDPIYVSSAQLHRAELLLRMAEPTIANGSVSERPGYLYQDETDHGILILEIGILSSTKHRINRRGREEFAETPGAGSAPPSNEETPNT